MIGFIFRAVIAALGLWLATSWVSGIYIDSAGTLVLAGLLLGRLVPGMGPALERRARAPALHAFVIGRIGALRQRREARGLGYA